MLATQCLPARQVVCRVWPFATPWTAARQAPLSVGLSRQEDWSGWPYPPPGDLPDPGIEPMSLGSPAVAGWLPRCQLRGPLTPSRDLKYIY